MTEQQVSKEITDGGSVHIWLDETSKTQPTFLLFFLLFASYSCITVNNVLQTQDMDK